MATGTSRLCPSTFQITYATLSKLPPNYFTPPLTTSLLGTPCLMVVSMSAQLIFSPPILLLPLPLIHGNGFGRPPLQWPSPIPKKKTVKCLGPRDPHLPHLFPTTQFQNISFLSLAGHTFFILLFFSFSLNTTHTLLSLTLPPVHSTPPYTPFFRQDHRKTL